jgi:hypothetical protein
MSKTGLITPEKLKEFVKNTLGVLEREDINSIGSVFSKLGKSFKIKGEDHLIQIESRRSESEVKDYTITYIAIPEGGVPIQITMNPDSSSSKIVVKTKSKLDGYIPVNFDYFGNMTQGKSIDSCSILGIKNELEKLVS